MNAELCCVCIEDSSLYVKKGKTKIDNVTSPVLLLPLRRLFTHLLARLFAVVLFALTTIKRPALELGQFAFLKHRCEEPTVNTLTVYAMS
jgi:hypothetical protein